MNHISNFINTGYGFKEYVSENKLISTGITELDFSLNGGLKPGNVMLFGAFDLVFLETTLFFSYLTAKLALNGKNVLYVSKVYKVFEVIEFLYKNIYSVTPEVDEKSNKEMFSERLNFISNLPIHIADYSSGFNVVEDNVLQKCYTKDRYDVLIFDDRIIGFNEVDKKYNYDNLKKLKKLAYNANIPILTSFYYHSSKNYNTYNNHDDFVEEIIRNIDEFAPIDSLNFIFNLERSNYFKNQEDNNDFIDRDHENSKFNFYDLISYLFNFNDLGDNLKNKTTLYKHKELDVFYNKEEYAGFIVQQHKNVASLINRLKKK